MLVVPPLAGTSIDRFGWRTTDILLGLGSSILLMVRAFLVQRAPTDESAPETTQPLGRVLLSMYASWVLTTMVLFVPFVFLPAFARAGGADPVAAAVLPSLLGFASRWCLQC